MIDGSRVDVSYSQVLWQLICILYVSRDDIDRFHGASPICGRRASFTTITAVVALLSPDAYTHSADYAVMARCLSVRASVTRRYCVETANIS